MNIILEPRERLILEISVAAIFLALVICGSIVVVNAAGSGDTEITNSFNTYNFYSDDSRFRTYQDHGYDYKDKYDEDKKPERRHLRYDSDARLVNGEGIFGNDIKKYEVYVRNREYVGGNFKVIFYFRDYNGETESYTITHYIPARGEKKFSFKDISPDRYKYSRWWYDVQSLTKTKDRY